MVINNYRSPAAYPPLLRIDAATLAALVFPPKSESKHGEERYG